MDLELDEFTDPFLKEEASYNRLIEEYEKYGSLTIGFDFDGTVFDYHQTGATFDNVVDLLRKLYTINCKLVCWTAAEDLTKVKQYLIDNQIPFDNINDGGIKLPWESRKPFFSALLDDRAGLFQVYLELSALYEYVINKR